MTREAEDLRARLKEIQMLRVKRSMDETDDERTTIDKLNRAIRAHKEVRVVLLCRI